jgi:hypothetical protein
LIISSAIWLIFSSQNNFRSEIWTRETTLIRFPLFPLSDADAEVAVRQMPILAFLESNFSALGPVLYR